MSLIASIFHFMFLYVLFPDIYFHSRETWNSWDGKSTYCVIQFSYEEKKKKEVQHVYLQFMSCQTESNMQQNPCFEHFGYQAHF